MPQTTGTPAPPTPTLPKAPVPTVPAPGSGDSAPMNDAFNSLDQYLTPAYGEPDAATPAPASAPTAPKSGESLDPSAGLAPADAPTATPKSSTPTSPKKETKDAGASSAASKDTSPKSKETPPVEDPDEVQVNKMAPAELRKAYNRLRNRFGELEKKIQTEEAKPAAKQDEEKQARLNEELEQLRSKLKSIEDERTLQDFEHSEPYKKEYYEPYVATYNAGREAIAGVSIVDPESGEQREATSEDFDAFMRITDKNAAIQYAKEVFGDAQTVALMHRQEIIKANNRRITAIDENKKMAQEHLTKRQQEAEKQGQMMQQTFDKHIQAAAEKFPQWFKPTEGESLDPKVNEMLDFGMKLVDQVYKGAQLEPQKLVAMHAAIRNKAGAFDRVAYELTQARKTISDLKSKLEAFEKSEPGRGTAGRSSGVPKPAEMDWQSRLDGYSEPG